MSSMEAKREQFRKYLERCGLLDALCKSLIKLYEEQNKPDDAIRFVRKYMCESCPDDEQFNQIKHNLVEANKKIAGLEEELEKFKGNLKLTPSQVAVGLENGWKLLTTDEVCKDSLLRKYLTRDVFDQLNSQKTAAGATLLDCIQTGFEHHDSAIGCYAADGESYDTFKLLFDPIMVDYHGQEENTSASLQKAQDWGSPDDIKNLDPDGKYIVSTRIRLSRNLDGYPFFPILSDTQFTEIETKMKGVFEAFEGDLKGFYTTMKDIDIETQNLMIARQVLFKKGDKFLATAGAYRFWPTGRGLFSTPEEDFLVWVNEEDHLRIISMVKSGDLNDVHSRLVEGLKTLGENVKLQRHSRYGFVSACPTNCGTSMRASVHIQLPNLSKDQAKFKEMTKRLFLQIRGTGGEHTEIVDGVMDISNRRRLGFTEIELLKDFQEGILELIKAEEEFE